MTLLGKIWNCRLATAALDVIFPPHCAACRRAGSWFCADCLSKVELAFKDPCAVCGGLKTHQCQAPEGLRRIDALVTLGFYHDPRLRAVIHNLKYNGATCLIPSVKELLAHYRNLRRDPWPWTGEESMVIQPLIGAPKRIRARGFDQAELISEAVQETIVPWAKRVSWLQRGKSVTAQADLKDQNLRRANVLNVYSVSATLPEKPPAVLLVDDVFTTGATMRDAARTLRLSGVERVYGFVLALGK
ncbi:hypothetical protein KKF59_03665 [Patescibacteria group bacterium]|nr:hypothetical protein [Patescibacteria group bacterium]